MAFTLSIHRGADAPLAIELADGECLFVVGANGTGKSSLMHAFYSAHNARARRMSAHRQTWFDSNTVTVTPQQKRDVESNIRGYDRQEEARWREEYSAHRANVAIYDLINAENVRARKIAEAMERDEEDVARRLAKQDSPLRTINQLLRISNVPIEITIVNNEELVASKHGGAPYRITQLSDGERNAVLVAATVLTVPDGLLVLIDEPERHLHRAIISPLLTSLFAQRPTCSFVVSTHDLALANDLPHARTVLVRSYTNTNNLPAWDVDVLAPEAAIPERLREDILGARRKILFVEGDHSSLDRQLYSLVLPGVSVVAKGSCRDVQDAVAGVRGAADLHWVRAFGLIDNDRRSPEEIQALRQEGIYALPVHSVESIYYHPDIQRRAAERLAAVTGADVTALLADARTAAIAAVAGHADRMGARVVEHTLREKLERHAPNQAAIRAARPIAVQLDVAAELASERRTLDELLQAANLEAIVGRYPVRDTPALDEIARRLQYKGRRQYEDAVRKLLADDREARAEVRRLLGPLANDVDAV